MKLAISYCLFKSDDLKEFNWYLRGIFYNARMNLLLFPNWETHVYVEKPTAHDYVDYLAKIETLLKVRFHVFDDRPRCTKMLWRIRPLWSGYDAVICRDADSITTQNDANFVQRWINSNIPCSSINNNPAHHGIMGGLCGFKRGAFPDATFEEFIAGANLTMHGSDQNLINRKYKGLIFEYKGDYDRSSKYWESNLTCAFMGSPGVNEMELYRFFRRHDPADYSDFEKQFPKIFYWHNL